MYKRPSPKQKQSMTNTPTVTKVTKVIETSTKMSEKIYSEKYDCLVHPPGIAQN